MYSMNHLNRSKLCWIAALILVPLFFWLSANLVHANPSCSNKNDSFNHYLRMKRLQSNHYPQPEVIYVEQPAQPCEQKAQECKPKKCEDKDEKHFTQTSKFRRMSLLRRRSH